MTQEERGIQEGQIFNLEETVAEAPTTAVARAAAQEVSGPKGFDAGIVIVYPSSVENDKLWVRVPVAGEQLGWSVRQTLEYFTDSATMDEPCSYTGQDPRVPELVQETAGQVRQYFEDYGRPSGQGSDRFDVEVTVNREHRARVGTGNEPRWFELIENRRGGHPLSSYFKMDAAQPNVGVVEIFVTQHASGGMANPGYRLK
ncbi:MAG: hypothetical protein ABH879_01355 [archaeon]